MCCMKIGVFDSGIGGQAVADRLKELIPHSDIVYVNDTAHVPYGSRSHEEIITLTLAAVQPLIDQQCDSIVIACNTATTIAINELRRRFPNTPFVGIEPMIKPASLLTHSRHIAVLATPATLSSERYKALKDEYTQNITVTEPDCQTWAYLIESNQSQDVPIESTVEQLIADGVDVIVLACTHYHWLKQRAEVAASGRAQVLEPSEAISERIITLLDSKAQ